MPRTFCIVVWVSLVQTLSKSTDQLEEFQSLAQINVGHRHCVPFSFSPLGPRGLWQIQNDLPQLTPGFFVVRLIHGSWWPSHGGAGFLVNSFDQSSLLAIGSITVSPSWDDDNGLGGLVSSAEVSGWLDGGTLDLEGDVVCAGVSWEESCLGLCWDVILLSVLFGLKKPLRDFCPGVKGVGACAATDFERFIDTEETDSLFSDRLRVSPCVCLLSSLTLTDGVLFPSDIAGDSFSWGKVAERSSFEGGSAFGCGLRANISLMLLRLSNSGISRPDVGKRYLVEYSC